MEDPIIQYRNALLAKQKRHTQEQQSQAKKDAEPRTSGLADTIKQLVASRDLSTPTHRNFNASFNLNGEQFMCWRSNIDPNKSWPLHKGVPGFKPGEDKIISRVVGQAMA